MKRFLILIFVSGLSLLTTSGTTITSVICGNWTSPSTWNLNRIPIADDTIVVNTFVSFDVDFVSTNPGMLNVTVCGTLCGLHDYTGCILFDGIVYIHGATLTYGHSIANSFNVNILQYFISTGTADFVENGHTCVGCTSTCQNCSTNRMENTICNPSGIADINLNALSCFPNPATNVLNIRVVSEKTTLRLYDFSGRLLIEMEVNSDSSLDTGFLPDGIYNLVSENRNGKTMLKVAISR